MSERHDWKRQLDDLYAAAINQKMSRRTLMRRATALGLGAGLTAALGWAGRVDASTILNPVQPKPLGPTDRRRLAAEQVIRLPEGPMTTMDPGITSGGWGLEQLQNLFEGLVGIDQRSGQLELLQAERMVPNDDASEFTFTLRSGLKWSDGTPITAQDYEWSWKRVLLPETKSDYPEALYSIKGAVEFRSKNMGSIDDVAIKATDDRTLKVSLIGPTPYFPLLVATWTYFPVPKHSIEKNGDKWTDAGNMASNGPFMLKEWKFDQSMTLARNPNYAGQAPTLERGEFTLYADPIASALVAFENNELDQAQVAGSDLDRMRADSELSKQLQFFPRSGTQFISVDTKNAPLDDPRVRQAMSMALNRKTLAEQILKGEFNPALTMLAPDIPGHNPAASLGEDVEKAKALLAQAGSNFPEITLTYATSATAKTVCEYLQSVWRQQLGLNVKLDVLEPRAFRDWRIARKTAPYHMYLSFWGSDWGDPANWHNQLFTTDTDFYYNRWNNTQFDQMVTQARGMTDVEKRTQIYKDAEKLLVQEASTIPLYNLNRIYVIKPNVKGIIHYPILGRTWLKYIWVE